MGGEKANQRMANHPRAIFRLQEAVAAVTGVLGEAVARRERPHAMSEQSATIPDLLAEPVALGKRIRMRRIHERMTTPHADVFVHAVAVGEPHVGVVPQETGQRVADVRRGAIFAEVVDAAAALPPLAAGLPERLVVDDVAPHAATGLEQGRMETHAL